MVQHIVRNLEAGSEDDFPDLKAVLLAMPDIGEDQDFARLRQFPPTEDDFAGLPVELENPFTR
jgi:hypothetical protein